MREIRPSLSYSRRLIPTSCKARDYCGALLEYEQRATSKLRSLRREDSLTESVESAPESASEKDTMPGTAPTREGDIANGMFRDGHSCNRKLLLSDTRDCCVGFLVERI